MIDAMNEIQEEVAMGSILGAAIPAIDAAAPATFETATFALG